MKSWAVKYVTGYLGCGINEYERESFSTKEEADNRAAELKEHGWYGVEVVRLAV